MRGYMKTIVVAVALTLGLVSPLFAQQDDTVYKPGNDVSLPKLVRSVGPHYTSDAMRRKVTGAVLLRCVVDRNGVPTSLEIVQKLDEELDQASLAALKRWRFEPGEKNGKPVLVQIDVTMTFAMQKEQ
jgi:protein TonB